MIKEYRIKHGFTQELTANYLQISLRQYQRIDKEEFMPRTQTLKEIFELFDIPIEEQKEYIWQMWLKKAYYNQKEN